MNNFKRIQLIVGIIIIAALVWYFWPGSSSITSNLKEELQVEEQIYIELDLILEDLAYVMDVDIEPQVEKVLQLEDRNVNAVGYVYYTFLEDNGGVGDETYIDAAEVYLTTLGFEYDAASLLWMGNQVCELTMTDLEDMIEYGVFCSDLDSELATAMPIATAIDIADNSTCAEVGTVSQEGTYNPNSKTWWFEIDPFEPKCSPACVISVDESAEVNWRCTGLIAD